ncbi:MAG TPA: nuclear transport factor 2 family protein [Pyrinomonadaceae bacterium]
MTTRDVVKRFWSLMESNDFHSVGEVLSDDFVLEWPQSGERIRGRDNFGRMNQEYPAHGTWRFTINRILVDGDEAVTDVSVTDGVQHGRVISFFHVGNGNIQKLLQFWPDPFPAPENRRHLVEMILSEELNVE